VLPITILEGGPNGKNEPNEPDDQIEWPVSEVYLGLTKATFYSALPTRLRNKPSTISNSVLTRFVLASP